jgi:hypothetical protein
LARASSDPDTKHEETHRHSRPDRSRDQPTTCQPCRQDRPEHHRPPQGRLRRRTRPRSARPFTQPLVSGQSQPSGQQEDAGSRSPASLGRPTRRSGRRSRRTSTQVSAPLPGRSNVSKIRRVQARALARLQSTIVSPGLSKGVVQRPTSLRRRGFGPLVSGTTRVAGFATLGRSRSS